MRFFLKKRLLFIIFFIAPNILFSAEYNYKKSNGKLSIEYSEISDSKTLQQIKVNDRLIAQHCYQNGKRIKDTTTDCSSTGGGTDGGTNPGTGGGTDGGTTTPYTIEYSIEPHTNGHRIQLKWTNLISNSVGIVPANKEVWESGMPGALTDGQTNGSIGITVTDADPNQTYRAIFYMNDTDPGREVGRTELFSVQAGIGGSTTGNTGSSGGGSTDGGSTGGGGSTGSGTDGDGSTSGGTDSGGSTGSGSDNTVVLPPAVAFSNDWKWAFPYTMNEPAMGGYVTDPKTGYKVWRLGGSQSEMHNAVNHPLGLNKIAEQNMQHFYSRVDPTNSDETYAIGAGGYKGGYVALWRLADKKLVAWVKIGGNGETGWPHEGVGMVLWDKNDNNVYWYVEGKVLKKGIINFDNYSVTEVPVKTFSDYEYITLTKGEGDFSDDGSKLIIVGSSNTALASDYILFYDVTNNTVVHTRERTKRMINSEENQLDWASVDPTGKWVVFDDSLPLGNVPPFKL